MTTSDVQKSSSSPLADRFRTYLPVVIDIETGEFFSNTLDDIFKVKLNALINKGEKSNIAAKKVAEQTGIDKKWLYSKLHKKLDK